MPDKDTPAPTDCFLTCHEDGSSTLRSGTERGLKAIQTLHWEPWRMTCEYCSPSKLACRSLNYIASASA